MHRAMLIRPDDLRGPEIAALLRAHLDYAIAHTPPESIHVLDLDRLRVPEISFWTAWDGPELLGCGALRALNATEGEVKSMHIAARHRGKGVGTAMLRHILAEARRRRYARLYLETGAYGGFAPARALYVKEGFVPCGRFGDYADDPNSAFMVRELG
jgi:putative acetyltransferase